ncbi:hypothetical protein C5B42_05850 [Candidatus Cerribacteria bacterium 'Amazon FNV 2010 28 9']|uniref:Undecaprenyl-phosphate alpha-N-acetylglucosaminyl 1-phosphate transferase n=1 Tax=Candidatus Cerribacteria bacterium 'Amazon FNV 2010 28 9' TaxID=2081795 RepID=A0A317JNI7_9BACT|nr:MAG: hypothetical protein C5B42_05850 [Candidatus Cerribacteria bacterium 'Amazon FNV 2010 28 9']
MMFVFPFLAALLGAVVLTPIVIRLYTSRGWLDDPKKLDHPKVVHTKPLPRGGGIALMGSILIASFLFIPIDKHMLGILGGGILLMLLGTWDDLHNPPPLVRLIIQVIAALLPIAAGIGIAYVTNPLGGIITLNQPQLIIHFFGTHTIWILADILALLWLVWCMNIVNFSTGLDGQMPGYVAIAALVIALLSLRFHNSAQLPVTLLSLIVAGAYAGFLPFNFYPQKILSGFGASTLAGFFLGVLAILSGGKVATAMLVLAVPMIDATLVIFNRLRQARSPFMGDRTHLHHKLMDLGWGKRRIAIFYWICTALLGFLALQLNSEQKLFTIVLVALGILGFVVWFQFFFTRFVNSGHDSGSKIFRSMQR